MTSSHSSDGVHAAQHAVNSSVEACDLASNQRVKSQYPHQASAKNCQPKTTQHREDVPARVWQSDTTYSVNSNIYSQAKYSCSLPSSFWCGDAFPSLLLGVLLWVVPSSFGLCYVLEEAADEFGFGRGVTLSLLPPNSNPPKKREKKRKHEKNKKMGPWEE